MDLLVFYYAWDLAYNKQFQILAFLQSELFGDRKNQFFSTRSALTNFFARINNYMNNIIIGKE